jgi:hypothetical protein
MGNAAFVDHESPLCTLVSIRVFIGVFGAAFNRGRLKSNPLGGKGKDHEIRSRRGDEAEGVDPPGIRLLTSAATREISPIEIRVNSRDLSRST